ncbi:UDP-N-acetylmuramoyl-tripeptide--D-alanyl-D-alanine ligase [Nocardia sp. NPDC059239]|uniref:UDP-N-acetylmuramoyl-tripeptide--D-alanyl-D- alanine ligase n=1 Tax=Nocardia sp. NPDC059239 TaxID=3346785 RepID=UPI0036BB3D19
MIPMQLADVAAVVGGRLCGANGDEFVTGTVEFDSRQVTRGGLFAALPGEQVDGHDFAGAAIAAGAAAVLAARPVHAPAVVVPPVDRAHTHARSVALTGDKDGTGAAVLAALAKLARAVAARLSAHGLVVVGITGSSGKTSTKDLMGQVLDPMGPTVAPPGSFNNELGHPWTVLRAEDTTRYLVAELSARGPGHIAALCETAPPRIGLVLNVGSAHLAEFGSREQIAATKGELIEALTVDGVAVLNADDPLVRAMASRTSATVVYAGRSKHADVRAVDIALDEHARARFRLATPDGAAMVRLQLHGEHHVDNAVAVAAAAMQLGASVDEIADRLSHASSRSVRRMQVCTRSDGVTIINDAYNANPESTGAALRSLAAMAAGRPRSWAVLGPMGELGPFSHVEHEMIGQLAANLGIDRVVAVGEQAHAVLDGIRTIGTSGCAVADIDAALDLLRQELNDGDVVLVKASKSFALWRIAESLVDDHARATAPVPEE